MSWLSARVAPSLVWGAFLFGVLATPGCGYTTSRIDDFPSARTVAVVPFENTGFRRDLELRLTEAVVAEVRRRTNLAISTPQRADLILSGSMEAREQVTVQARNRQPIQKLLSGRLRVTVKNRSGQILRSDEVSAAEQYRTMGVYNESLEGSASDEWTRRMAVRIVQVLERGF